jgi:hypothetical protein
MSGRIHRAGQNIPLRYNCANILAQPCYIHQNYWCWRRRSTATKFTMLCLFLKTTPINYAVACGNGNKEFYRETNKSNNTFKFQITLDRHNPRLKLNLLHDPPNFSLLSTFNLCSVVHTALFFVHYYALEKQS